jgi:hypothetical protein
VNHWHNDTHNNTIWQNFTVNVDKWHNQTFWKNQTVYGYDFNALKAEAKKNLYNVFDNKTIESRWGTNTTENRTTLEDFLAKDGIADVLTKDPALWKQIQAVEPKVTPADLYFKSWTDIATLVQKAGYASGYDSGKQAADAVISAFHDKVLADGKSTIKVFNDSDWQPYTGSTIENITAIENFLTINPQIVYAYGDSDISDYLNHIGLNEKAAYTDKSLQSKVQSGIEYKYNKGQIMTLDENDFGDAEKATTLNYLAKNHAMYPWLVVGLDETNTSQKDILRTMLNEQSGNLSENFKQAIRQADIFYMWAPDSKISAPLMYGKDTDSLFPITDKDLDIAKQYLL